MPTAVSGGSLLHSTLSARRCCWSPVTSRASARVASTSSSSSARTNGSISMLKSLEEREGDDMSKVYRTIPADQVLRRLPAQRQRRINLRAAQLIAEEVGLSELRKAKRVTQEQLAKRIGGRQVYISRFEKRSDVRL